MSDHPRCVVGFVGSLDELAKSVGNMTYDQTASFVEKLADDFRRQADADLAGGRKKLASELYAVADKLYEARDRINSAWKICKPYMNE